MSKGTRIQFRVTETKKQRFSDCADKVKMKDTALGEAAVDALCDYIEAHGEITLPLAILPESVVKKLTPFLKQAGAPHASSFPSTARAPHDATTLSLNEPAPTPAAAAPTRAITPAQPLAKTRRAIKAMVQKEKPKS